MSENRSLKHASANCSASVHLLVTIQGANRTQGAAFQPCFGWRFASVAFCCMLTFGMLCPVAYSFEDKEKAAPAKPAPAEAKEAAAAEAKDAALNAAQAIIIEAQVAADEAAEGTKPQAAAAPVVPVTPTGPMLHLANGGFLMGEIKDTDQPKVLRWQSPGFAVPFDFAVNSLSSVSIPLPAAPPRPVGEYCFELAGGDVLFGSLLSLTPDMAELDVSRFGRLQVARSQIRRLVRWNNSADLIYMGPNGLGGWESTPKNLDWREEAGHLVTDKEGAAIRGKFELPPQASIEFEISWTKKPDFELALGVDDNPKSIPRAYKFEVWESDLVIQRETDAEADLASLQEIKPGAGRLNLQVFLDQVQGRAIVFSSSGKQLASLHVPDPKVKPLTGVRLMNKRGDLRLERLRIARWNGEIPREVETDKSRIHRPDGSIAYGLVQEFDSQTKEFILKGETENSRVAAAEVQSVVLSQGDDPQPRSLRAAFQDGVRISGELSKVEGGHVWLTVPGIKEPLHSSWSELQSLVMLTPSVEADAKQGRIGRLEMAGTKLQGRLIASPLPLVASCLAWRPIGSANASPLLPDTSCRIIYRDSLPVVKVAQVQNEPPPAPVQRNLLLAPFVGTGGAAPRPAVASAKIGKRFLHLRTGDTIPCEISRIDDSGVTFKTTMSDSTFATHDKIKAVELASEALQIKVGKTKRERLLTLPRMQRDNPPTHLIRSINGDYLRGRLTEMDEKKLTMEVRLESRDVERDRIAKIIWLHEDEIDPSKKPKEVINSPGVSRVQVVRSDGIRLTYLAESMKDDVVIGKSDVLGVCRADLNQVDQFLVGNSIEAAAAELANQKWKLQHAIEPLAARDADPSEEGRTPGIESSLVGKPAPDFDLDLHEGEGKKLKLSSLKGKVVVLDFFASWCGPCMQVMPEVDHVVGEFKDKDVRLIAVNLEETPARVKATLDRLKLNMTVAMDREGLVANQYGATSIPQTVVIDPTGKVVRVFVGSSPQFADNLREALTSQFAPPAKAEEAKPEEPKPVDPKTDETKVEETKADEAKSEVSKTEAKKPEESKPAAEKP